MMVEEVGGGNETEYVRARVGWELGGGLFVWDGEGAGVAEGMGCCLKTTTSVDTTMKWFRTFIKFIDRNSVNYTEVYFLLFKSYSFLIKYVLLSGYEFYINDH